MGRNYQRKDDPVTADLALIWDAENSDWRLSTLANILALFNTTNETTDVSIQEPNSQYSAPLTGFTVAITDNNEDTHLILTPAGTLATGTITLPSVLRDKQLVIVNSTQEITALTVDGNGATVVGAPTTLSANGYFTLKYDLTVDSWYRIA